MLGDTVLVILDEVGDPLAFVGGVARVGRIPNNDHDWEPTLYPGGRCGFSGNYAHEGIEVARYRPLRGFEAIRQIDPETFIPLERDRKRRASWLEKILPGKLQSELEVGDGVWGHQEFEPKKTG